MKNIFKIILLLISTVFSQYSLSAQVSTALSDSSKIEQVNVAYGIQNKREVTGSVEVVESKVLEATSFTNTQHSIIGQFAGMIVQQNGGGPGSDNCSFTIRGQRTTGSSGPLVLIDGFEGGFAQISTIEIENITILKDAAATAIYGLRGANGVILVTTKRGYNGRTQINATAETGIMEPYEMPGFVDAATYAILTNEALSNDGLLPRYSADDIAGYTANNNPYLYPNVDWMSEMMKKSASYYNGRVEVKGGDENMKFYVGGNYLLARGLLAHTNSDNENRFGRLNLRANVDIKVKKNTEIKVGLSARMEERTDPEASVGAIIDNAISTPANRYVMYNEDGSFGGNDRWRNNPLAQVLGKGYSQGHSRKFTSFVNLKHELDYFVKGLYVGGAVSFSNQLNAAENFSSNVPVYELSTRLAEDGVTEETYFIEHGTLKPLLYKNRDRNQDSEMTFRGFMGYDVAKGDNGLSFVALYEHNEVIQNNTPEPFRNTNLAARLKYGFKNRYYAEVTTSYSGVNHFGPGKRFGLFPAVGLGWIASDENFLKNSSLISYLKVRGSYGLVGNDKLNGYRRFMYLINYEGNGSHSLSSGNKLNNFGTTQVNDLPNPDATFEKSYQGNIGFDATFAKIVNVSFDMFTDKRVDILQSLDNEVTNMVGVNLPRINFGEVKSHGFELNAGVSKKYTSGFNFSTNLRVGYRTSEILKRFENNAVYKQVGNPISQQYGLTAIGFYQDANDIASSPVNSYTNPIPGDVKYADISGPNGTPDGIIDNYDIKAIGDGGTPELNFGVTIQIGYKGFYASANVDGLSGVSMMLNNHIVYRPLQGGYDNISTYAADNYWTSERGANATLPRLSASDNNNNYRPSTLYQRDASFVNLRTAEVGYHLPKHIAKTMGMKGAQIYMRGHNLISLHDMDVNPEVPDGHPQIKSYTLGVNVKF